MVKRARRGQRYQRPSANVPTKARLDAYGISQEEWRAMFDAQGGCCAICLTPFGEDVRPCIDHDHDATVVGIGAVRGLLCTACNKAEGHYASSVTSHLRGALYLLRSGRGAGGDCVAALIRDLGEALK